MSDVDVDEYREQARTWLAENLEPRDRRLEVQRGLHEHTREEIDSQRPLQRKIWEAGYAGITWPTEYGGQGLTPAHERAFSEEAQAYVLPDFGIAGGTTFGVCANVMLGHASDDFKRRHLPRILAGDELWVQFFSEPVAGSDLAGIQTRATKDGDNWVLNGAKVWSTYAHVADWGMCLARTDWDVPKHRGLTWFGVPTRAPGVTLRQIHQINGGADFCEEFFDDVMISDDERIGDVNEGWTVTTTMLVFERGGGRENAAPRSVGPGALAPDLVALAKHVGREKDPTVRQLLAKAHTNDFVYRELTSRIGTKMRQSKMDSGVAAYGKLAAGMFNPERARIGLEIGRGAALTWAPGDEDGMSTSLAYLNCRIMSIAGGTNEMQRNGIGERVLGLPREPSFDRDKPFSEVLRDAKNWSGRM